jgi:cytochrome c oxidase subunit II
MNELYRTLLFLPPQESTIAEDLDRLHYLVITVTMLGSIAVLAVALYFPVRYRHVRRFGPRQRQWHMPLYLEVGLIVGLLAMFLWWWWIGVRQFLDMRQPPDDGIDIYVMGKQWMWKFTYPDGHANVSDLYVPAGTPIKLTMTSRDVIHSFFVPEFRVKHDVIPGRYTTLWFEAKRPGVYEILCTEYCGEGHSTMRGRVHVLAPEAFSAWIDERRISTIEPQDYVEPFVVNGRARPDRLELAVLGERVAAQQGCLRCHTTDGSPHIGPSFGGLYGSTVDLDDGSQVVADAAYITRSMMDPLAELRHGYQPVMPSYQGLLTPPETAAIVEFIRSLRDVEPDDARVPDVPFFPGRQTPPPAARGIPRYPATTPPSEQQEQGQ